ncbi:GTP cyclohydrolase II [Xenorhabdus szentirmaii]|uniref:GTP cyclohydrolase-2 n=1 Tax=Xenorhabdus szentirmaii DSM 16338 TaxID=1427518 RepID=W1IZE5_9GAMM|nr:GTP cyclohydrolase II [Xenorhabdus szentirmaii]PHM33677.1 riboflavin biosynthesis protein ribA/GTP-cyclohydrolase II [Xenorhabdus szentirmaii DSM 16338]PHM42413.1 riboflavin biosynthesis protein ribA/GTP-cyclohydrolase II [Xenorhabdus szentirmaii]CDL83208.1 GTP cyclohydrolase-2 [Xenorhabdus szentirmaii DSM 16338]
MKEIRVRNSVIIPIENTSKETRFITFSGLDSEHFAISIGELEREHPVLIRIHSECLTGDVFGSHRCDCGFQLQEAIRKIDFKGNGIIIYLRQEGRGIGLYPKIDAYDLQSKGIDTFTANEILGYEDDLRSFDDAVLMLKALNINSVDLITNNPEKVDCLTLNGVNVNEVIPTGVYVTKENREYLKSKVEKKSHTININQ